MPVIGDLTYTYDLAGNRIKQGGTFARSTIPPTLATASYNVNNQQTTFGTNTLTYDFNGNLQTVTDAGGTATYSWNARNQLTGISNTGFAASFTYDSFGRRTGKTIQGTTTNFVYDGLNPVQEKSGATVTANLLTGLGIDEFFTRTDGAGSRALLTDALGSTVALGDGTGTIQTQYTYEPFGYASQSGQANTNSYKYTGREDDGSGLSYYRARYYHPRLQRFIAEDPIGLRGGINFYGYALNSPLRFIDPMGWDSLAFNGRTLTHYDDFGKALGSYPATSGVPGVTDPSIPWQGPIPPGVYHLDPDQITQAGFLRQFTGDWGDFRVPLHPDLDTNTYGRKDFFIHGGNIPGSAGCIDMGKNVINLLQQLKSHKGIIYILVTQ